MKKIPYFPERFGNPEEVSYIKLHHRYSGEEYVYKADDCKFHGKNGLWKKHLEWLEFKTLLRIPTFVNPMTAIACAIAKSRFWVVDELCKPYQYPDRIYGQIGTGQEGVLFENVFEDDGEQVDNGADRAASDELFLCLREAQKEFRQRGVPGIRAVLRMPLPDSWEDADIANLGNGILCLNEKRLC